MTRIDFYILQSDNDAAFFDFSCRLVEKAVAQGNTLAVHLEDQKTAEHLDDLLWSFRPESYLPHALLGNEEGETLPIMLTYGKMAPPNLDVLVNLSNHVPESFAQHKRFAQIVNQEPSRLELSRKHFAFFKERGYPIEINKLKR